MAQRTLLLFDVDGVLIAATGYKQALRSALDYFAEQMGQPPVALTLDEIALFESLGMTNEWLAGPLCIGAILIEAANARPALPQDTFAGMISAIRADGQTIPRPDFSGIAQAIVHADPIAAHEPEPVLAALIEKLPGLKPVLTELLTDIRPPVGPVAHIIQHFTLGHERFEQTYGTGPIFTSESYLATLDQPGLSPETSARLMARLGEKNGLGGAIFTARPSLPPRDIGDSEMDGLPASAFAPEAELAVEALRFDFAMPIIAEGRMVWLEAQSGKPRGAYVKPSPVQALAAIGAAQSGEEKPALLAAAEFAEQGTLSGPLAALAGEPITVVVFEDSTGGMSAVQKAVATLQEAGLDVTCEAVGVAAEESKRDALMRIASRVVPSLDEALEPYLS